jgi:hypothetical protein
MVAFAADSNTNNSTPRVFGVTELIQDTNKPYGQSIVLEGFPSAVCKRSGKKAWLHDVNSDAAGTIRVEKTGEMRTFNQDVVGKTIRVTGILRELRMDKAYFDAWEARVKATLEKSKTASKEDGCTEQCEENVGAEKVLKNIQVYRKKLEKSPKGYLSAFWVDGSKWDLVEAKSK